MENNVLEDDFRILSNQNNYKNDPCFIHLLDSLRIISYIFVHHIDVWFAAAKNLRRLYDNNTLVNAGTIFNSFVRIDTKTLLSEHTFSVIQNTFSMSLKTTYNLGRVMKQNQTNFDIMFECCKYFFIPVRLNSDSIPHEKKETDLRNWLLVVMTLPFIRNYTDKYYSIVDNIQNIYSAYDKFELQDTIQTFVNTLSFKWIQNNVISEVYNQNHPAQIFIRVFIHVSLLASIEILKIYNPTLEDAKVFNTNYDGTWLIPVDPMYMNDHLPKLHGLFKFVMTKKR
jgi:hypothetical protein